MSIRPGGLLETPFARRVGIEVPIVCGAMYPCSNPELVAAVSGAGGIGVVQPISLTYVHGHDFREGLRLIGRLTSRPIGMNALIEQSSRAYRGSKYSAASPATSGSDDALEQTTGAPDAIASATGKPNPSYNDGYTNNVAPA